MTEIVEIKERYCLKRAAVKYRTLKTNDALNIAQLHVVAFPKYFLTELGIEFSRRYYKELIGQNELSIGAYTDHKLVGFIVGGSNVVLAISNFYRKNLLFCCWKITIAIIRSSIVRKGIFKRISHILIAFQSIIKTNKQDKKFSSAANISRLNLLSIAVHPEFMGSGIAEDMLKRFEENLSVKKIESYYLSTKKENKRAISFYKKAGMIIEKETKEFVYFRKMIE